jgi:Tfp pilus assembly protein PilX
MKGNSFMQRIIFNLDNEQGSAIVMALIVLVILTIIGIVSTSDTVFELQIVRNEAMYRRNFYRAESAIVESAQLLETSTPADSLPTSPTFGWLETAVGAPDMENLASWKHDTDPPSWTDPPGWTAAGWPELGTLRSAASINMDDPADQRNNTRYAAICNGIAAGSSLSMTNGSNLYAYSVYGLFDSTTNQGRSLIRMGYYKSF